MRILVVASYARSLILFRGALLKELIARGHSVHATAASDAHSSAIGQQLEDIGVSFSTISISRHSINPIRDLFCILQLVLLNFRYRPNCVLSYTVKPVVYSSFSTFLYRLFCRYEPVNHVSLITGLGFAFTSGRSPSLYVQFVRKIVCLLYRISLKISNHVVFQNPDDLNELTSLGLISNHSQTHRVWGSGVDLKKFPPQPLPTSHSFLMLSRLLVDKGIREYLAAADLVKEQYPSASFYLAGMLDSSPASIDPAELQYFTSRDVVHYLGNLESVNTLLQSCRYFVLPSYREGMPRSILEAMATSRPILTTDVPGCRETVIDGLNGFLVPPFDTQALAHAMTKLIQQSEKQTLNMASHSLMRARMYFDVRNVNSDLIEIMGV